MFKVSNMQLSTFNFELEEVEPIKKGEKESQSYSSVG